MLGHNQMTLYPYDKSTHPSNILFLKTTQGEKENQHTVKKTLQSSIFLFLYFIPKKKKKKAYSGFVRCAYYSPGTVWALGNQL